MSKVVQNVLLGLLGAAAVAASAAAFWSVNRPVPTVETPGTAQTVAPAPEPAAQTTEPVTTTQAPEPARDPLVAWQEAVAAPDSGLLVLGDGYSNLPSQWLQLWAERVGAERPVQIYHWGEAADVSFNEPIELSTGEGPGLTVWSASRAGSSIEAAADRVDTFTAEAEGVDAVLVSLGRSSGDEDVPAALDTLVGQIGDDLPVLVVVGPSGFYEPGVADAIADWSLDHEDRVALVDLREAGEPSAEEWAQQVADALAG